MLRHSALILCLLFASCNSQKSSSSVAAPAPIDQIVSTYPVPGETQVQFDAVISATFLNRMDAQSLHEASFQLFQGANQIAARVALGGPNGNVATLSPTQQLVSGREYRAVLTTQVRSFVGVALAANYSWMFTTVDSAAPQILEVIPRPANVEIPVSTTVQARFSEPIDLTSLQGHFRLNDIQGNPVPSTLSYDSHGHIAILTPVHSLAAGSQFFATLDVEVSDLFGNHLAAPFAWDFSTYDDEGPTASPISPPDGAEGVSLNPTIEVQFSEPLDPSSVNSSTIHLDDEYGTSIPISIGLGGNNDRVLIAITGVSPYEMLGLYSRYLLTFTTGITDFNARRNPMAQDFVLHFRTTGGLGAADLLDNIDQTSGQWPAGESTRPAVAAFDPNRQLFHSFFKLKPNGAPFFNLYSNTSTLYDSQPTNTTLMELTSLPPNLFSVRADSQGNAYAVWQQPLQGEGFQSILAICRQPGIQQWSLPATIDSISTSSTPVSNPEFVIVAGAAVILWAQATDAVVNTFSLDPNGNPHLGVEEAIDNSSGVVGATQIAIGADGTIFAAWEQTSGADTDVVFNFKLANESSWTASRAQVIDVPTAGDDSTGDVETIRLAVLSNGDVAVVWSQKTYLSSTNNFSILARVRSAQGNWGIETQIDAEPAGSAYDAKGPSIAARSDGTLHVIFAQKFSTDSGAGYSVVYRQRQGDGSWSPIQSDTDPETYIDGDQRAIVKAVFGPQLAVTPSGDLFAVWRERETTADSLMNIVMRKKEPGQSWGPIQFIDNDGPSTDRGVLDPFIEPGFDREVYVVFPQFPARNDTRYNIYGVRYR